MDVRRLRSGELLSAAGAIGLLVVLFADWFGGASGWSTLTVGRVFLLMEIALALTFVVITLSARAVSMATSSATVTIGFGAPVLLYLLFRVGVDEPGPNALVSMDAGAYLGVLCLVAIIAGAWRAIADERTGSSVSLQQTERVLAVRGTARPTPTERDAGRAAPAD